MDNEIFVNTQKIKLIGGRFPIYSPSNYALSNFGRVKNIKTNEIIESYVNENGDIEFMESNKRKNPFEEKSR